MSNEAIEEILRDTNKTKEDIKKYYNGLLIKLKENYEKKLQELDDRFKKQASASEISDIKNLARGVSKLTIELFIVKTWKGKGCKYCEALTQSLDEEKAFDFLKSRFLTETNFDKKNYQFDVIGCDWSYIEGTPSDNPIYKKFFLEEGINYLWLASLGISGFPSLRLQATMNNSIKVEQLVDGVGRYSPKDHKWSFGMREIVYGFLEQAKEQSTQTKEQNNAQYRALIDQHTHRDQTNGAYRSG